MFINDEKIGDLAVEVVGQIHVAVKRDYCFFFNFKSILHKKHTILCSTEYLLHKKLYFFILLQDRQFLLGITIFQVIPVL